MNSWESESPTPEMLNLRRRATEARVGLDKAKNCHRHASPMAQAFWGHIIDDRLLVLRAAEENVIALKYAGFSINPSFSSPDDDIS